MSYLSLSTYKTLFDERTNYLLLEKNKNYMPIHQTFCTIFMYKQFLIVTKVKSSSGDSRLIGSTITLNVCILGTEAVWLAGASMTSYDITLLTVVNTFDDVILIPLMTSLRPDQKQRTSALDDVTFTYLTTSLWLK
jgi:hypothetical protein